MPYLKQQRRSELLPLIKEIYKWPSLSLGDLNYIITHLLLTQKPASYAEHNGLMGVLECVKHEWYRRMLAPYEDKKIKENEDVYPSET